MLDQSFSPHDTRPARVILRVGLRVLMTVFVVFHLLPLVISFAYAGPNTPTQEVRVIDRGVIHLQDVFPDVPASRNQEIGPAPQPGQEVTLNARTLMTLASAYHVDWTPKTADDSVTLKRDGMLIGVEEINTAVKDALIRSGAPEKFTLTYTSAPTPIALPKNTAPDLSTTDIQWNPATSIFSMRLAPATLPQNTMLVSGKIEVLIDVPVLRTTLTKGQIIDADDIEIAETKSSLVQGKIILDPAQIVGLTARRTLMPGKTMKEGDVEIPRLIARGDKIALVYKNGPLELSAQGRALDDGRQGDRVRVVNTDSNKNLQGTVLADHRVMID